MAIFSRKQGDSKVKASSGDASRSDAGSSAGAPEKKAFTQRKPANTAFKQQRLKAWQPILTPKTVLPTFFLVGIIFAPIGAVLYYFASKVSELRIDYTECKNHADMADIPSDKYDYQLAGKTTSTWQNPQWEYVANTESPTGMACNVYFNIPEQLDNTVLFYYRLTNYYQNHRRYVKSIDSSQLLGNVRSPSDLQDNNCKPLGSEGNKGIYPCGLIANSMFNDTFFSPVLLNPAGNGPVNQTYSMKETDIIWPGEKNKYVRTKQAASELVPPPFWRGNYSTNAPYSFPNGYTEDNIFDPSNDEHFMVWMRVAGLPTFRKLYMRNDTAPMPSGRYRVTIYDNYPVAMFNGTKSFVISTVTWVGGRSLFLGAAYIATAALCVLLGLIFTARHLVRPRKLGDLSLLSWNE